MVKPEQKNNETVMQQIGEELNVTLEQLDEYLEGQESIKERLAKQIAEGKTAEEELAEIETNKQKEYLERIKSGKKVSFLEILARQKKEQQLKAMRNLAKRAEKQLLEVNEVLGYLEDKKTK